MKPALLLPIAVALLLAGSVISWWKVSADANHGKRIAVGLLMLSQCEDQKEADGDVDTACTFQDDTSQLATARHWTFLVGVIAAALLIALQAAPIGSRLRTGLAAAGVVATAGALMLGLGVLSVLIYVGVEIKTGIPGLGGLFFIGGAILGLRITRTLVMGEPAA